MTRDKFAFILLFVQFHLIQSRWFPGLHHRYNPYNLYNRYNPYQFNPYPYPYGRFPPSVQPFLNGRYDGTEVIDVPGNENQPNIIVINGDDDDVEERCIYEDLLTLLITNGNRRFDPQPPPPPPPQNFGLGGGFYNPGCNFGCNGNFGNNGCNSGCNNCNFGGSSCNAGGNGCNSGINAVSNDGNTISYNSDGSPCDSAKSCTCKNNQNDWDENKNKPSKFITHITLRLPSNMLVSKNNE